MRVKLLFFGATAQAVGARSVEIDTPDGSDAHAVLSRIIVDHPQLKRYKILFSVNEEYVPADTPIVSGDELAVFTAVSGG